MKLIGNTVHRQKHAEKLCVISLLIYKSMSACKSCPLFVGVIKLSLTSKDSPGSWHAKAMETRFLQ